MRMKNGWLDLKTGLLYGRRIVFWTGMLVLLAAPLMAKNDPDPNTRGPIISGPKK